MASQSDEACGSQIHVEDVPTTRERSGQDGDILPRCRSNGKELFSGSGDKKFIAAYCELHRLGWAHSVETWQLDAAGIAEQVRNCGFPNDYPLNQVFCTSLNGHHVNGASLNGPGSNGVRVNGTAVSGESALDSAVLVGVELPR